MAALQAPLMDMVTGDAALQPLGSTRKGAPVLGKVFSGPPSLACRMLVIPLSPRAQTILALLLFASGLQVFPKFRDES